MLSLRLPDAQASAPAPKFEAFDRLIAAAAPSTTKNGNATRQKQNYRTRGTSSATLTMLTPIHDQTIRNNQGLIDSNRTQPQAPGIGEQLQLMLDGRCCESSQTQPTELKGIDRGTHPLQSST